MIIMMRKQKCRVILGYNYNEILLQGNSGYFDNDLNKVITE